MILIHPKIKSTLVILMIINSVTAFGQNNLIINGTAPTLNDGTEILLQQFVPYRFRASNKPHVSKVTNHRFKFTLNTDGAELYYLGVNKHGYRLFLEPGKAKINIADSVLSQVFVTGNPTDLEYDNYNQQRGSDSIYIKYSHAQVDYYDYRIAKHVDTVIAATKWYKMDSLRILAQKQELALCLKWIKEHPNSLINTSILYDQISYVVPYISEKEVRTLFHSMPNPICRNIWGNELRYRIDSLFIGATAPKFSQPDTGGRQVSLASFSGKYVLIDFWASWCIPCREENPRLMKLMQRYGGKNFTILNISVDDKRQNWVNAIKQDGLYWPQLSSLQGRENPVALQYYVRSFPYNYLIDPNGKIIGKNLNGDELMAKLHELLE